MPDLSEKSLAIPSDILKAIKANRRAWSNFQRFSESYLPIRVAYITAARNRPGEFKKRLAHFVCMTEENWQFGFGGIEKYY